MAEKKFLAIAFAVILLMGFAAVSEAKPPQKYMRVFPFGADDYMMYVEVFSPSLSPTFHNLTVTEALSVAEIHHINRTYTSIEVYENISTADTIISPIINTTTLTDNVNSLTISDLKKMETTLTNDTFISNDTDANLSSLQVEGGIQTEGTIGIGIAPDSNTDIYISKTRSGTALPSIGVYSLITQSAATSQSIYGVASSSYSTHTSGTISNLYGYFGGAYAQSSSAVTNLIGVYGAAVVTNPHTPSVTVLAGIRGDAAADSGTVTYGISGYFTAPVATTGSIQDAISILALEPTTGTRNYAGLFLGDIVVASDKKLLLEGGLGSKGDTYLVYDSTGATMDFFVNGLESLNIDNVQVNVTNKLRVGSQVAQSGITMFDEAGSAVCMMCWANGVCNNTAGSC